MASHSDRSTPPTIQRAIDVDALAVLSDAELDAAEDDGVLGGNQHYQDLQACTVDDLRFALRQERALLDQFAQVADSAEAETLVNADRPPDDERHALWHLDIGVVSAVLAVVALGGHAVLSCNGGAFGGVHAFSTPQVRFYLADASPDLLLRLAEGAGIGLTQEDGLVVLYGRSTAEFWKFACLALNSLEPAPC